MIVNKIASLEGKLRETRNDLNQREDEIRLVTTHIRKEIQELVRKTHHSIRDQLVAVDAVEGEKIGKTWSNQCAAAISLLVRSRTFVGSLRVGFSIVRDPFGVFRGSSWPSRHVG